MRNIRAWAWLPLLLLACDPRPLDGLGSLDPCAELSDVPLQKQVVPLLVGGAMDEKTDPRLIQSGSLVNIVDGYRLKSGELRSRNGYAAMTKVTDVGLSLAACRALFPLQGGNLGMIGSLALPSTQDALYEYSTARTKWVHNSRGYQPMPMAVTTLQPLESKGLTTAVVPDQVNPDYAVAGTLAVAAMVDNGGLAGGTVGYVITEVATGNTIQGLTSTALAGGIHRAANGGTAWLCVFVLNAGAPASLFVNVINTATLAVTTYAVTGAVISAGGPIDVMAKPGGNNILVAYAALAGGVTVLEFDPSTGAVVTGPVNHATGGGVLRNMAWMPDNFATGFTWIATCDSTGGIFHKKLVTATLALSASTLVDGTAGFCQGLTGYVSSAGPTLNVIWDNAAEIRNSAGSIVRGQQLNSKAFLVSGRWYIIANFTPTGTVTQPTSFVIPADTSGQDLTGGRISGIIMPSVSGGLIAPKLITSVVVSGTKATMTLARVTKTAKTIYQSTHQVVLASVNFAAPLKGARELSGTTFFPGGMVTQFDGTAVDLATFPLYPDNITFTTAVGGAMTASGVYQYVGVYRSIDSAGRIRRSAPSIPVAVTLGAGDHSAQVSIATLRIGPIPGVTDPVVEFYRAGPAAAGGILYNKVGEVASSTTVDQVTFNDATSDIAAASLELLYDPLANSGVLNNFPSPSTSILEVLDNRVFVVSAENPTEIWASKEYKTGQGLAFNPGLVIRITGGPIIALAAMDGRLIAFQAGATWVIPIGAGPNDQGQGSFGDPGLVSLNVGCADPGSVVVTPDGIMFRAAQGVYILTRGLAMQYIGAGVEDGMAAIVTASPGFAAASLVSGTNQVRFVSTNAINGGAAAVKALVWDYFFKQWFEWKIPATAASVVDATSVGGAFYYVDNTALVLKETPGAFSDFGVSIAWSFTLPSLAISQLGGWFLTYGLKITGAYQGSHLLIVSTNVSYETADTGVLVVSSAPVSYQFERLVKNQKATSIQPIVSITPFGLTEGARISGLSAIVGIKPGRYPLPKGRRLT